LFLPDEFEKALAGNIKTEVFGSSKKYAHPNGCGDTALGLI
jgi:hypothetical protein